MNNYMVFDTETNGLPVCKSFGCFFPYNLTDKYNKSRVVQVSYIIANDNWDKLEESDTIIKADNFKIENHQFHGITNEISEKDGIPFVEFAKQFSNSLDHVHTLVAHNIDFDFNVVCAELYRYGLLDIIQKIESKALICTMKRYKYVVCAKFKHSTDIKYPSLKELYTFATGEEMKNHHNSMYDTINLLRAVKMIESNSN